MCGRFTLTVPSYDELATALGVTPSPDAAAIYRPRYNLPPTDPAWILRMSHGQKELVGSSWGIVPRWSKYKEQGGRPINARAESAMSRPLFRDSLVRRRCAVVADGFLEWEKIGKERRPYWIRPADGGLLLMGGIWDRWRDEAGERLETFSILTTAANDDVAPLHDRMPVVIARADLAVWLAEPISEQASDLPLEVFDLMRPAPAGTLVRTRVSKRVGSVKNDDPACLEPPSAEELADDGTRPAAPSRRARAKPAPSMPLFEATDDRRKA